MKKTILAAALALAFSAWAQAPEQKAPEEKAAAATTAEAAKPAPKAKVARKTTTTARRHQDARHCLDRPNNDAIIRCAEEYL